MLRVIIAIIIVVVVNSCNQPVNPGTVQTSYPEYLSDPLPQDVAFDFTIDNSGDLNRVNCVLYNKSPDTVYFLSSTCNGMAYRVVYDTAKFDIDPGIYCNMSWPVIEKLAPHRKIKFNALFMNKTNNTDILLGFDLHRVSATFDINMLGLRQIYYWPSAIDKDILWTPVKKIN